MNADLGGQLDREVGFSYGCGSYVAGVISPSGQCKRIPVVAVVLDEQAGAGSLGRRSERDGRIQAAHVLMSRRPDDPQRRSLGDQTSSAS